MPCPAFHHMHVRLLSINLQFLLWNNHANKNSAAKRILDELFKFSAEYESMPGRGMISIWSSTLTYVWRKIHQMEQLIYVVDSR